MVRPNPVQVKGFIATTGQASPESVLGLSSTNVPRLSLLGINNVTLFG